MDGKVPRLVPYPETLTKPGPAALTNNTLHGLKYLSSSPTQMKKPFCLRQEKTDHVLYTPAVVENSCTSINADVTIADYVFGTLFLCAPDNINDLRANSIIHLRSILDPDPSSYLTNGVLHNTDKDS